MYHRNQPPRQQLKTYDIHPTSIKLIKQGHPWVTIDQFSERFHPKDKFIIASNKAKPFALLIHDPTHKSVRGRVWSTQGNFSNQIKGFKNDLAQRINKAIKSRFDKKLIDQRENFYLIFGEGDQIPGVFVQYLGGEILIQFYMNFWAPYKDFIIQNIMKSTRQFFSEDLCHNNVWYQHRSTEIKAEALSLDPNTGFKNITVSEFGVNYKVTLGKFYDHGIYTDMSSIRKRIEPELKKSKSVLNLFSYTGAFSLFALKCGANNVISVDLSETYIDWLEENIKLNPELKSADHCSMVTSTKEALADLKKKKASFDFIISDPPSSSSDGQKRTNALQDYAETLPKMCDFLSQKGHLLLFLNTHKNTFKKFEDKIKSTITSKKLSVKIVKKFYLSDDCPTQKGFPEGAYLKGLLLQKFDLNEKTEIKEKAQTKETE